MFIIKYIIRVIAIALLLLVCFSAIIYRDKEKEVQYTAAFFLLILMIWSM